MSKRGRYSGQLLQISIQHLVTNRSFQQNDLIHKKFMSCIVQTVQFYFNKKSKVTESHITQR